jgi:hypothetical protein
MTHTVYFRLPHHAQRAAIMGFEEGGDTGLLSMRYPNGGGIQFQLTIGGRSTPWVRIDGYETKWPLSDVDYRVVLPAMERWLYQERLSP